MHSLRSSLQAPLCTQPRKAHTCRAGPHPDDWGNEVRSVCTRSAAFMLDVPERNMQPTDAPVQMQGHRDEIESPRRQRLDELPVRHVLA